MQPKDTNMAQLDLKESLNNSTKDPNICRPNQLWVMCKPQRKHSPLLKAPSHRGVFRAQQNPCCPSTSRRSRWDPSGIKDLHCSGPVTAVMSNRDVPSRDTQLWPGMVHNPHFYPRAAQTKSPASFPEYQPHFWSTKRIVFLTNTPYSSQIFLFHTSSHCHCPAEARRNGWSLPKVSLAGIWRFRLGITAVPGSQLPHTTQFQLNRVLLLSNITIKLIYHL